MQIPPPGIICNKCNKCNKCSAPVGANCDQPRGTGSDAQPQIGVLETHSLIEGNQSDQKIKHISAQFSAGSKGVVIYGISYAGTLKLRCASTRESKDSLVVAIMRIAEQIGFSLEVAGTEKHHGWEWTRFDVGLPAERRKSRKR